MIQVKDDGSLDLGGSSEGSAYLPDSGFILKVRTDRICCQIGSRDEEGRKRQE